MRSLILALTLLCLSPFASAAVQEDAIGVSFPNEVDGFVFSKKEVFPQKGLGVAIRYLGSGPVQATVYIYTGGLSSIPDGPESAKVQKHFAQVIDEVKMMETLGHASKVTVTPTPGQTTSLPGCGPQFVWKAYEMDLDGSLLTSYTYLTAVKDNFVKLRITYKQSDAAGKSSADRFIAGIRKVLGNCQR